ncbi:NAD(P)-dependent oxidoreductase [Sinorhizobium meliloti]|uniref:NAD(P)-dependent oxidoreductase n=1 Tax=Rhizobium meliloti TaxID=382 RepID=UPI000FD77C05|nr:NAD(P)-dependent oxidoreductase [Sinorhizobium meliloti]MDX0135216.1 hypothetical protein [Sinorhizobium meliloti]RVK41417.1 hypothetical protein CN163_06820 [Sinorhizobium meliloti]
MTKPLVAIFDSVPQEVADKVRSKFSVAREEEFGQTGVFATVRAAVTTWKRGFSAEDFSRFPKLEIISVFGTGQENINMNIAKKNGITVTTTALDGTDKAVADYALALMLTLVRQIHRAEIFVRSGNWSAGSFPPTDCLQGKSVGIVGLGYIGARLAALCHAMGLEVLYTGPNKKEDKPYGFELDVNSLASKVDIIFLSCRGDDKTIGMINKKTFEMIGPNGYLINISQPKFINENDLIMALKSGSIRGAALDVYPDEPFINEQLRGLDNVVLTPHAAALTRDVIAKRVDLAAKNIIQYFG